MIGIISICISVVAAATAIASFWQTQRFKHWEMRLSFFQEYTRRYQEIEIGLLEANGGTRKKYIRLYFDLCSEEYYLKNHDCLPKDVWEMWEDGMKLMMKTEELQTAWIEYSLFYNDDFAKFFGNLVKECNKQNISI